mmetsp:Transcript_13802/g.22899  ORF Transcript_13802/g.22899 Transcript_13802/m.22899 type:complete len:226 (+) Transcript_13802:196-873(+)
MLFRPSDPRPPPRPPPLLLRCSAGLRNKAQLSLLPSRTRPSGSDCACARALAIEAAATKCTAALPCSRQITLRTSPNRRKKTFNFSSSRCDSGTFRTNSPVRPSVVGAEVAGASLTVSTSGGGATSAASLSGTTSCAGRTGRGAAAALCCLTRAAQDIGSALTAAAAGGAAGEALETVVEAFATGPAAAGGWAAGAPSDDVTADAGAAAAEAEIAGRVGAGAAAS